MAGSEYRTTPDALTTMPPGIPFIVGNEAAERFSFYGMKAILFVFMTKYLLSADGSSTELMTEEQANTYVHLFVASAYFFPIIGAVVSDWLFGKYLTILSLSIVYCLGHLALALDETRVGLTLGLTLIAIGAGGIKPCVSAHVGDQFGKMNQQLLPKIFSWFYFSINLGAFASSVMTPKLLQWYGPQVAFGVPGGLMLLATWVFWLGRHKFVHIPPAGIDYVPESLKESSGKAKLSALLRAGGDYFRDTFNAEGRQALWNLARIFVFVAMFWSLFDQTASKWVGQAEQMDRHFLGVEWLSSQVQAVNPILVLLLIPVFSYLIYPALDHIFPLTPLRKVSLGFFVMVLAFGIPALIEENITGGQILKDKVSSQANPELLSATNLLDEEDVDPNGNVTGRGWVSTKKADYDIAEAGKTKKKTYLPQTITFQLRERRAWEIDSVEINPASDLNPYFEEREKEEGFEPAAAEEYYAREVEVLVSAERDGPWKSVGKLMLKPKNEFQTLRFSPVKAEYVAVKVLKGGNADAVSLGGIRVDAAGDLPAEAHPHAEAVWPNVAATGHKPKIIWQVLAYVILTSAEILVSITCLEFSYTQAPPRMKSLVMSLYLLSVSLGNLFTSLVNKVIQNEDGSSKLPGASYYWFFTGMMLATAVVFIYIAKTYRGKTYIQNADPLIGSDDHDLPASEALGGSPWKTCPKCGHANPASDLRCEKCDTELPET